MAAKKSEREQEVDALLDELLKGQRPEDNLNKGGLVEDLTKRLVERALEGAMTDHLDYEKHAPEGRDGGNSRNGKTRKRIKTGTSEHGIEVPRDRDGEFEPKLVPKGRRSCKGFPPPAKIQEALQTRGDTEAERPEAYRNQSGRRSCVKSKPPLNFNSGRSIAQLEA